jgi:hypothetical protein
MPQTSLLKFPCFRIDERNLLGARVIVTTYSQPVRLLSPEPCLVGTTKVYSGLEADIVMESFHSKMAEGAEIVSEIASFAQAARFILCS